MDELNHTLITDFGLAKYYQNESPLTQEVVTPIYMAPEVLETTNYNFEADVYSFRIMLLELISGVKPFAKMSRFKISHAVTHGIRPSLDFPMNPLIKKLIEKCLSHDPSQRPSFKSITEKLALDKNYYVDDTVDSSEVLKYTKNLFNVK